MAQVKREGDDLFDDEPSSKRQKVVDAPSHEDLEKEKKKDLLRAQIAAKMSKLKQLKEAVVVPAQKGETSSSEPSQSDQPSQPTTPQPPTTIQSLGAAQSPAATRSVKTIIPPRPMALLLDEFGRQIDEHGNVIVFDKSLTATTLINKRQLTDQSELVKSNPLLDHVEEEQTSGNKHNDPRVRSKGGLVRKQKPFLNFVTPGKFTRRADNMRHRLVMKDLGLDKKLAAEAAEMDDPAASANPNLIELIKPKRDAHPTPNVEWWDLRILPKEVESYDDNIISEQDASKMDTTESHTVKPEGDMDIDQPNSPKATSAAIRNNHDDDIDNDDDTFNNIIVIGEDGNHQPPNSINDNSGTSSGTQQTQPSSSNSVVATSADAVAVKTENGHTNGAMIETKKPIAQTSLLADWNPLSYITETLNVAALKFDLRKGTITPFVQHPVPITPRNVQKGPLMMPVMLTKAQRKKLRRRNRALVEKEKQDKIRMGLMDAPAPKVKISNMMRVYGQDHIQDPTKVEAEVRKQAAARLLKHEEENKKRMLTDDQRKEKKKKKMFGKATAGETLVSVFRVRDLSDPQHRFKIDVNATENVLSGIGAVGVQFSIVVVEGGKKSISRYQRLMERRIKWNERCTPRNASESVQPVTDDSNTERPNNECNVVWQGTVAKGTFQGFRMQNFESLAQMRAYFEKKNVPHYFDMCKAFKSLAEEC